jgi:hypothetical protein
MDKVCFLTPSYLRYPLTDISAIDNVSATPFDMNPSTLYNGTPYTQAPGAAYDAAPLNEDLFSTNDSNYWGAGDEMWYLPPGAAFFQNVNDQAITQTAEGVNVGGMDLLDYMTIGDFPDMDGAPF